MDTGLKGQWFRSDPITHSAGASVSVPTAFLNKARKFDAPEVAEILFRFEGSVTAAGGDTAGTEAFDLIDNIKITDQGGDIYNATGKVTRVIEQMEIGNKAFPTPSAITSAATNASYNFHTRVLFEVPRAERPADFRVPLVHFLQAGEIALTLGTATNHTVNSGTWRLYARVVDNRKRELKSRMVWRSYAMGKQEDNYPVNGFLRAAILTSHITTAGYTDISGQTTFNSRALEYPASFQNAILKADYRYHTDDVITDDQFLASATGAYALALPYRGQKIGRMPELVDFDFDYGASVPSGGRVVVCSIQDRNPELAAQVAGYASVADLQAAMFERGEVVSGGAGNRDVKTWAPELVRRLPVRVG